MRFPILSRRQKVATAVMGSLSAAGLIVLVLSASLSAQPTTSGADLAQEYLAALKPAGLAISTAEAKLQKLPVTASVSEVKAIVAPLGPALGKLEALNSTSSTTTVPLGASGTLESLGRPVIRGSFGCGGSPTWEYNTPGSGAVLEVGYARYQHGFQMTVGTDCTGWVNYSWKVPTNYTALSASLGVNYNNSCKGAAAAGIRVLGNDGSPLRFRSSGNKLVGLAIIKQNGLMHISVKFAGNSVLTIQLDNFNCGNATAVIDVINDRLS